MNPHFASLVLGLAHQPEATPATAGHLDSDEKQLLEQALTSLRFRFVQSMPKA